MPLDDTLQAVGGNAGIVRCLAAGNDAPLDLVLLAAQEELAAAREALTLSRPLEHHLDIGGAVVRCITASRDCIPGCPGCRSRAARAKAGVEDVSDSGHKIGDCRHGMDRDWCYSCLRADRDVAREVLPHCQAAILALADFAASKGVMFAVATARELCDQIDAVIGKENP